MWTFSEEGVWRKLHEQYVYVSVNDFQEIMTIYLLSNLGYPFISLYFLSSIYLSQYDNMLVKCMILNTKMM